MTVRAKLKDLAPGTVFNAGPIDVRVLEHFADGRTLLIADTCIADRHFAYRDQETHHHTRRILVAWWCKMVQDGRLRRNGRRKLLCRQGTRRRSV